MVFKMKLIFKTTKYNNFPAFLVSKSTPPVFHSLDKLVEILEVVIRVLVMKVPAHGQHNVISLKMAPLVVHVAEEVFDLRKHKT